MAAYRVDWRLRPYGGSGELAHSLSALTAYYDGPANDWEVQALLRLRPGGRQPRNSATNCWRGHGARSRASAPTRRPAARACSPPSSALRELAVVEHGRKPAAPRAGHQVRGRRDTGHRIPGPGAADPVPGAPPGTDLRQHRNRHRAAAASLPFSPPTAPACLREDYLFLRGLEHYLQVFEDRQVHVLPSSPATLARPGPAQCSEPAPGRRSFSVP